MISVEVKKIMGNAYLGLNRLAKFRSRPHERILDDSFLLEEEKKGYGYETGDRFLPYKWQDLYSRERREIEVSTIVMENEHVRAEFYPRYGMRLASLIQKDGSGASSAPRSRLFEASVADIYEVFRDPERQRGG